MSNLNFSNNIFLGRYELDQLQYFIQDEGYQKFIKNNSIEFGIINNSTAGNFDNSRIIEGVGNNTIKYNSILGIDIDGKFFAKEASSEDISVGTSGSDTAWYWVKLVRAISNLESGTINISSNGTILGVGTDFLNSLRGVTTDFPTKIKFPNSTLNTGEYEILSVASDTTAQLNVSGMTTESSQEWQIVPTTTPSAVLTTAEKRFFNYDSATVSLVAESSLTLSNGLPQAVSGEYWLARVRNSGTDVEIQDKRSNYLFKTVDGYFISNLQRLSNPLIGAEAIKFAATTDPRDKNIVEIAFAFRSSNWTSDATNNRITLIAGNGGKFKDTSDFTSGDFDGYRLYYKSGKYAIIKQSTLSATQINLTLDSLDVSELSDTSQQLLVTPDCSEIEIYLEASSATPLDIIKETFPINTDICRIKVPVTASTSNYIVKYRHKHIKDYGAVLTIPDDPVGYYDESSFNNDGSLKGLSDRVQSSYTNGTITLTQASDSYSQLLPSDKFGVDTFSLDSSTINNQIIVGVSSKEQIITGTVTLSANKYINLRTTDAVAGNQFFLQFECDVTLNGNEFEVVQEYSGSGDPANTLFIFDDFYLTQSAADNLLLRCTFDGTNWKVDVLTTNENDSVSHYSTYIDSSGSEYLRKIKTIIYEIGDWNMDIDASKTISTSIGNENWISISVLIRSDGSPSLESTRELIEDGNVIGGLPALGNIKLTRNDSGDFDSTNYDSTSYNRGWVYLTYWTS